MKMGRPTMHDVARVAGVSQKTVSNVINGYPYVRDETRQRVTAAMRDLGYQVNAAARNLRVGRTGMVGLAVPDLQLAYFGELAGAVIAAADERGWRVLIEQTNGDRARELDVLAGSTQRLVDGLVFVPMTIGPDDLSALTTHHPVVLLNEPIFGHAAGHVTMQHYAGARAATEHLIAQGRTRVAAIGVHPDEPTGSAADRRRGYRDALEAAGLRVDPRLEIPAAIWHRHEGAAAAAELLASGADVDAIFCFNDALALGALRVLLRSGRAVPDDVALMGFDDVEDAAYSIPSLSTVSPHRDEMARLAVAMLAARIDGEDVPHVQAAGFHLMIRESTVGVASAGRATVGTRSA
jgi:DNA-binding LacI/PurR family transcriptional regulator